MGYALIQIDDEFLNSNDHKLVPCSPLTSAALGMLIKRMVGGNICLDTCRGSPHSFFKAIILI